MNGIFHLYLTFNLHGNTRVAPTRHRINLNSKKDLEQSERTAVLENDRDKREARCRNCLMQLNFKGNVQLFHLIQTPGVLLWGHMIFVSIVSVMH